MEGILPVRPRALVANALAAPTEFRAELNEAWETHGNSGVSFAGILAIRDRRLLALFTPNGPFGLKGSLTLKLPLTLVNRDK